MFSADIPPRKLYSISDKHGEYRWSVAIFSRKEVEAKFGPVSLDSDEELIENIVAELTGWSGHWGGPGRWFAQEPSVRIMKRNIVIRQFSGLDI